MDVSTDEGDAKLVEPASETLVRQVLRAAASSLPLAPACVRDAHVLVSAADPVED
jgi:hypothetical protein